MMFAIIIRNHKEVGGIEWYLLCGFAEILD